MNKLRGIVWAPLLIVIGTLAVAGIAGYVLVQTSGTNEAKNGNMNIAVVNNNVNSEGAKNVNQVNSSTNTPATNSQSQNTNSSNTMHPPQSWDIGDTDAVWYRDSKGAVWTVSPGKSPQQLPDVPEGYSVINGSVRARLVWVTKNQKLYLWDRSDNSVRSTSLPNLVDRGDIYDMAGPIVYSTDGIESIIRYSHFDKNSEEYKNEFMGPQPVNHTNYQYNLTADTYSETDSFSSTFYRIWDRQGNFAYNFPSGEGIGNVTPIKRYDIKSEDILQSPEYGNNSGPGFSTDGKWAAVPVPSSSPLQIHIFALPDVLQPIRTLTLPEIRDADTSGNQIGYVYDVAWSPDNSDIILSFKSRIFLIDAISGQASLVFENKGIDSSYTGWSYYPTTSLSGRYVFWIDYDNSNQQTKLKENNIFELKVYDVSTGETKTLFTSTGESRISLVTARGY